jgi:hypothetical protein
MLHYLSEADTLQVAASLIKEAAQQQHSFSAHLLLSTQTHRTYSSCSTFARLQRQSGLSEPLALELLQDMVDSLLLPYTRKEHSGHLLSLYLASGIKVLAKLSLLFLQMWITQPPTELNIASAQSFCAQLDFPNLVPIARRIKLSFPSHSELMRSPEVVNVTQYEQVTSFLNHQSLRLTELIYSSARDGIALKTLLRGWDNCVGPHLLLLFSKPPRVFGVFLDRRVDELMTGVTESTCVLFKTDSEWREWTHRQGQVLLVERSSQGLSVGGALGLEVPLADGWSEASAAFENPSLHQKKRFSVFFVEMWRTGS